MSPALRLRLVRVYCLSDGIALLQALGEGDLLVSTRKRKPGDGHYNMAECRIDELKGKTEAEIYAMLDKRMDKILEREAKLQNERRSP